MSASGDSLAHKLNSTVPLLHVKLYIVIMIVAAICIALISLSIFLCIRLNRSLRIRKMRVKHSSGSIPLVSKEILEVRVEADHDRDDTAKLNEVKIGNLDLAKIMVKKKKKQSEEEVAEKEEEGEDDGVNHDSDDVAGDSDASVSVDNIGWGRWYGLKELEIATRGFSEENVIGEGGYGVVYRGVLSDGSVVAVKNLLNNKYI